MSDDYKLSGKKMRIGIDRLTGYLRDMHCKRGRKWEKVQFRQHENRGPSWFVGLDGCEGHPLMLECWDREKMLFANKWNGMTFSLRYELDDECLKIIVAAENNGGDIRQLRAGICLGLDTCMIKFPDWNEIYFPTLMRCEKTHFWGYAMTPRGRILGVASPDPVASWRMVYNTPLHRIYTTRLELMSPGPVPSRHLQNTDSLKSGERREWTIFLSDIEALDEVKPVLSKIADIPILDCDRYTVEPGQEIKLRVFGGAQDVELSSPSGEKRKIDLGNPFVPGDAPGVYTLTAISQSGKVAEAKVSVRKPWSWYMKAARSEAIRMPQKGTSHTESWYGLFSCFGAQKHFPDPALDKAAHSSFDEIFPLMYDTRTWTPTRFENRIQNHSCAAGLLAMRYQVTGDMAHLEAAVKLVDFLLGKQSEDGAYRNHGTHYTSVIYIAKSIMEVMACEKQLAASSTVWKERYERHFNSVKLAMDNLAEKRDDIETEGEMTYEDGMISCSFLQLSMFALLLDSPEDRKKYVDAALYLAKGHRCLSQLLIPDSRMNGCTLRFWEAQYDVLSTPNMLNSPHGWSAWRIYGLWYIYQLTGDVEYLRHMMNALGSCVQLIDFESGVLRWAFVPDPQISSWHFEEFPNQPGKGRCVKKNIGEEYVPMIGNWYHTKPGVWSTGYWGGDPRGKDLPEGETWPERWHGEGFDWGGDGGSCDNDVHEIFKCLEETALASGYVFENQEGRLLLWNCSIERSSDGCAIFIPAEDCVSRIHFNLRNSLSAQIRWPSGIHELNLEPGMNWIGR